MHKWYDSNIVSLFNIANPLERLEVHVAHLYSDVWHCTFSICYELWLIYSTCNPQKGYMTLSSVEIHRLHASSSLILCTKDMNLWKVVRRYVTLHTFESWTENANWVCVCVWVWWGFCSQSKGFTFLLTFIALGQILGIVDNLDAAQ